MSRSDQARQYFRDIVEAIDLINRWVLDAGGEHSAIHDAPLIRSAIERQLLVISEAAIRLHKLDQSLSSLAAPEVDWAGVRGIGNFIRHRYDDLDTTILVNVLGRRLSQLRQASINALEAL